MVLFITLLTGAYAWRNQNDPFPAELQDLEEVSRVQFVDLSVLGFFFVCFILFFVLFLFITGTD